jgi:hypothetical protein
MESRFVQLPPVVEVCWSDGLTENKMPDQPEKIVMQSEPLNDVQKALVINHLWLALRQTFVLMHELNGPQVLLDLQQQLIAGVENSDTTGFPLDQEKPVVDTVVKLLEGLVTFEA